MRLRTVADIFETDERRPLTKSAGEIFFGQNAEDTSTPEQRIAERERKIEENKTEIRRINQRDFENQSRADRQRVRELSDQWSLLLEQNTEDEKLAQRERATHEQIAVRKARPQALTEARARLATLRKCAASVESGHAKLGETDLRRLRHHLLRTEIEVGELERMR